MDMVLAHGTDEWDVWIIEEGDYKDQWAMMPDPIRDADGKYLDCWPCGWVPTCDLVPIA